MGIRECDTILSTRGLSKKYGDEFAVRSLDIDIFPGEVFGFLGPNGAGKTTTLRLILGLVRPTAGSIYLFGEPAAGNFSRLLRNVGAVVEAPALYPYLTGRQNLQLLGKIDGIPDARIDEVLDQVGLSDFSRRAFQSYSTGMKQRLGIAAALLRRPRLVILDEPTTGLDPAGQRDVRSLIPRLAEEQITVFLSSHLMYEVQEICDRVGILRSGKLIRVGPVRQLLTDRSVIFVTTPNSAGAIDVLKQFDWVTKVERSNGQLTVEAPPERSGDINRALAAAGIFATEIAPRDRSLEDYFLEVTGSEKQE